jgi:hypothetical protein
MTPCDRPQGANPTPFAPRGYHPSRPTGCRDIFTLPPTHPHQHGCGCTARGFPAAIVNVQAYNAYDKIGMERHGAGVR